MRGKPATGDFAAAMETTDRQNLNLELALVLLFGSLMVIEWRLRKLNAARLRERGEAEFALDVAADELRGERAKPRRFDVDSHGEAEERPGGEQ